MGIKIERALLIGAVVFAGWIGWNYWNKEIKEAHVVPSQQQFVARNWGTIERVSTERNILAGQAVGQTMNYNGMGNTPAGLVASNGIGQVMDLSVFAATMRSTTPIWAQNYAGRAVGQE